MTPFERSLARRGSSMGAGNDGTTNKRPSESPRHPPAADRIIAVDTSALRANGCLPEESQDRLFADHYREIKRPLLSRIVSRKLADDAAMPQVILVTSALPGDGKTFTSINLALSMARERDFSVLLVDADIPKPHISEVFGLRHAPGLLDALIDETLQIESLVLPSSLRGLSILPVGQPAEGAAEHLSSNRMQQIVTALIAHEPRRIVLLDSPPLLITSEARALIRIAGQIVLVIRAGRTPRHAVQEVLEMFEEQQVVGLVLNEGRPGLTKGYYGYGKYGTYGAEDSDRP